MRNIATERKEQLTIEKATPAYLKGELSSKEYVEIINNNPNRPDYERLAENLVRPRQKR